MALVDRLIGLASAYGCEPREVHHFCSLAGYGAEAINRLRDLDGDQG